MEAGHFGVELAFTARIPKRGMGKGPEKATSAFAWKISHLGPGKPSGKTHGATIAEFESNVYRVQRSIP